MKIDPRQLEILAAIVDSGGLTDGAAALAKSQPSLSRSVALLEARIGAPLFQPHKRPLQPTELGLRLAQEGRRILQASSAASDAVQGFRAGRAGSVRIGGTPVFMDGVIVPMIAAFQMQNPEVRIEQSYGYAPDLTDRIRNGTLDIAICPLRAADLPRGVQFAPILPGRNVIACRDRHPLAQAHSVTEDDLLNYPWIAPPTASPLFADLQRVLADLGASRVRITYSGGSLSAVLEVLAGSDSLTVLPYSVVFKQRAQYRVRALSIKIVHPDRNLGLLHAADAAPNPAVMRLRSSISTQIAALAAHIQHQERQSLWRGDPR